VTPNEQDLGFIVEDALDVGLEQFVYIDSVMDPKNMKDRAMIAGLVSCLKSQNERIIYLENKIEEISKKLG
jgi:hypothetical protein